MWYDDDVEVVSLETTGNPVVDEWLATPEGLKWHDSVWQAGFDEGYDNGVYFGLNQLEKDSEYDEEDV